MFSSTMVTIVSARSRPTTIHYDLISMTVDTKRSHIYLSVGKPDILSLGFSVSAILKRYTFEGKEEDVQFSQNIRLYS